MKIAYTGWTWLVNHKDNYKWEFEQFLKEIADLKYEAVENFAFITGYFDNNADEVSGLLKKYGLEMANLYHHYSEDEEVDYQKAVAYVDFMKKIGATYLNLQGVMWKDKPNERPTDPEQVKRYAALTNRIGKLCDENGIVACFHPHANTAVFSEEQIDLFVSHLEPGVAGLCLDTAHTVLAGMDPVKAFAKYAPHIRYVHLKDVGPDLDPENPMNRFLPLGMGTVDFQSVVRVLKESGYDGILCVELDRQPVCNYHSAMVSRMYLHNTLGF